MLFQQLPCKVEEITLKRSILILTLAFTLLFTFACNNTPVNADSDYRGVSTSFINVEENSVYTMDLDIYYFTEEQASTLEIERLAK